MQLHLHTRLVLNKKKNMWKQNKSNQLLRIVVFALFVSWKFSLISLRTVIHNLQLLKRLRLTHNYKIGQNKIIIAAGNIL